METLRLGSPLQPAAQAGAVAADSTPTTPNRISFGWVVVTGPELKVDAVPVAPALVSIPVTPASSSTLTWVSAAESRSAVIVDPAGNALTRERDHRDNRSRPTRR